MQLHAIGEAGAPHDALEEPVRAGAGLEAQHSSRRADAPRHHQQVGAAGGADVDAHVAGRHDPAQQEQLLLQEGDPVDDALHQRGSPTRVLLPMAPQSSLLPAGG
jgi:hypothetical protein